MALKAEELKGAARALKVKVRALAWARGGHGSSANTHHVCVRLLA
jgi:hypothetical protein